MAGCCWLHPAQWVPTPPGGLWEEDDGRRSESSSACGMLTVQGTPGMPRGLAVGQGRAGGALSLCHPISSYADGPGPVTEKRSSAAAAPPWPGALSRAWSGSVLSPQPGLVRFGPLSPVLWILSPQPGPVRCPQPTSVPSARFSPPLGRAQSPQSGSVSLAQFCPLGPVLSPRLGPLGPVLSPQPRSVSTIRSLQPSPAPSVRPVSLSLSLSPFRPVPVPSARFCPFGPVLLARFRSR